MYLSVDLAANNFQTGWLCDSGNFHDNVTSVDGLSYGSNWAFDSSLMISVCSDYNKANSIGCKVQNMKVLSVLFERTRSIYFTNSGFSLSHFIDS